MNATHLATEEKFKDLRVWQQAHELTLLVYKITKSFPDTERFALVSQMRRAAISVVANIVEGSKHRTTKDRIHFHVIANGSLEELKYYFILSLDLGFINQKEQEDLLDLARGVGAMLHGLTNALRSGV
ncbi:MAG: four helix bundle protein [Patescibacteria group bacterium]|jgi:four helix bundle protein